MKLPKFLNSLQAIMIPMLILILGFWIDASVLFYRAFAGALVDALRYPASIFLGFAVALPLLLTAINNPILPGLQIGTKKIGFPELFGIFTILMVLMFFDFFNPEKTHPASWYYLVLFLSLFLGLIDYLYAYLYVSKYKLSQIDWKAQWFTMARRTVTYRQKLKRTTAKLSEYQTKLSEASHELNEYRQSLTCPHCGHIPEKKSYSAHRNHVTRCPQNPNNQ